MREQCAAVAMGILLCGLSLRSAAQKKDDNVIEPARLTVTNNKTTNLIFPYPIKSVDKGSKEILVQKAIGVENVLQVKAAKVGFDETNLTVITSDGSLFSFILNYALIPSGINVKADQPQVRPSSVAVFSEDATTDRIQKTAVQVSLKKKQISRISDQTNGIKLDLKGVYLADDNCYLQLSLQNSSVLDYDVKMLRMYVRDIKKSKRTASQELELNALYTQGNVKRVAAYSEQVVVICVHKFSIPDKKRIEIEMMESGGGRHLLIHFGNPTVMKAIRIN